MLTDRFDLLTADLPDASRANGDALRFFGDFLRAKSAKDVDATMQFFSRDSLTYADGTLGMTFHGWGALHGAYSAMMPQWGSGQSYPVMVWGEIVHGNGSALVHLVDTPELFGGEARIFASVDVRAGDIVRWVDYWDSSGFSDKQYADMHPADLRFPADFGEQHLPSLADPALVAAAQALHAAITGGTANELAALLHPDVVLEDVAAAALRRGVAATVEYLTAATAWAPFGRGARLCHVIGGSRGGGYEWRAVNGRPGMTGLSIDADGKVLRVIAAYDHRAFAPPATA